MGLLVAAILFVLAMPLWGIYLIISKNQVKNRGLGVAVLIVGLIIWGIIKYN